MRPGASVTALTVLLAAPVLVSAQEGPSIFTAVNDMDRIVTVGAAQTGRLTTSDLLLTGGRRVQVWSVAAQPGSELQVDMRSSDFDTYLYVVGPGLGSGIEDDDGGDGLNSRVCFSVTEPQGYRIVAAALGSDVGGFTLSVAETVGGCGSSSGGAIEVDLASLPTEGRVLSVGDRATGRLTGGDPVSFGSPVQAWAVHGTAGQPFSVDLLSDAFDAYLTVLGPGLDDWMSDDDGAGGCNSRVTLAFPETGTYRVIASTLGSGAGEFTLVASEQPGPESPESCVPSSNTDMEQGAFEDVPVSGELEVEGDVLGTMRDGDVFVGNRAVQGWTLTAGAGDRLALDLVSEDFDAYLSFTGPGFPSVLTDDDGGEGLDSRLCVHLPEDGTYRIFAGPLSGASIGSGYRLSARSQDVEDFCDSFEMSPAMLGMAIAELPTDGRTLQLESEVESSLVYGEVTHPESGQSVQPWSLRVPGGRSVTVDVVSYAFDPVLYIAGAGLGDVLYNDDGDGPGCQSRITFELDEDGLVTLLPGALYDGGSGPFLLRASTDPGELEDGGCVSSSASQAASSDALEGLSGLAEGELEIGMEVEGVLTASAEVLPDGSWGQVWTFEGSAGDRLAIGLSSDDFDAYLYLAGPGLDAPLVDDDGGGGLDSRLEVTLPESGRYRIVASALSEGEGGAYRLYVVRRFER